MVQVLLCVKIFIIYGELLDIFYSIWSLHHKNLNIKYILITENISLYLETYLIDAMYLRLEDLQSDYSKITSKSLMMVKNVNTVSNIKNIKSKIAN